MHLKAQIKSVENSIENGVGAKFVPLPKTLDLIGDDNVDAYGKSDVVYLQENTIYQFFRLSANILNMSRLPFYINAGRHIR